MIKIFAIIFTLEIKYLYLVKNLKVVNKIHLSISIYLSLIAKKLKEIFLKILNNLSKIIF
jgi:hypothetical protein